MPLDEARCQRSRPGAARRAEGAGGEGRGYLGIQSTRPLTVGYGWPTRRSGSSPGSPRSSRSGPIPRRSAWRTRSTSTSPLTNVSLYWFTGTATSAANFLYEAAHSFDWPGETSVPAAWAVFGDREGIIIRRVLDPQQQVGHWSEFDRGGHFAAMEAPDLLAADLQSFFGGLRKG